MQGERKLKRFLVVILLVFLFVPVANAFDFQRHVNTQRFTLLNRTYDWAVYFDTKTVKFGMTEEGEPLTYIVDVWQRHYYVSERNQQAILADLKRYGRAISEKDAPVYEMYHCVYDMQNRTITPIQRIIYTERGTVLLSTNFPKEQIVIIPDTEPEAWLDGVAEYAKKNKEKILKNAYLD